MGVLERIDVSCRFKQHYDFVTAFKYTFLLILLGCSDQKKSTIVNDKTSRVTDICISRNDFGQSFKSICFDSSGFYYEYRDTIKTSDTSYKTKRIDLSTYKSELQLFKSLDSTYFLNMKMEVL